VFLVIVIGYTCTYMPYKLSFVTEYTLTNDIIEWVVDIFFYFDLVVNFFFTYDVENGVTVTDSRKIAKNYLTSWFLLDVIACVPTQIFGWLGSSENQAELAKLAKLPRIYRLIRIVRILRMLKLVRYTKLFSQISEVFEISAVFQRLVQTVLFICLLIHLMACIWFFTATLSDEVTWIVGAGI
jgi:hypothetical protein